MITQLKSVLRNGENLYEVVDKFRYDYFLKDGEELNLELLDNWKGHLKVDTVLRSGEIFFMCKRVEDIEFEMISTDLIPS